MLSTKEMITNLIYDQPETEWLKLSNYINIAMQNKKYEVRVPNICKENEEELIKLGYKVTLTVNADTHYHTISWY